MQGKLKTNLRIGQDLPYYTRDVGSVVSIIGEENHPIYGERYKIVGSDEWFEKNCFEWIR